MDTQYVSRKHRTTASLAAELRHIAQMLDDWDNAPIEPTLLCVDMLVESEDEVARATVERLHHLVFTNPPVYSRASGHYGTSFEDATSGRHTWIKAYGKTVPPDRVIAEAWDAAHAEQAARTVLESGAGGENTRIPPAVAVTDVPPLHCGTPTPHPAHVWHDSRDADIELPRPFACEGVERPPAVSVTDQVLLNQMKAAAVKCCEAGKVAYPEPCPWHGLRSYEDLERGAFLASAMLDPDATLQIPAVVDYRTVTP